MTEDRAKQMLKELAEHYGEPVRPVSEYCAALESWVQAIQLGNAEKRTNQGASYVGYLGQILIDIRKSALLGRMIYGGEKLRTVQCPRHKGKMDTHMWCGGREPCPYGCQGSGWLPDGSPAPTAEVIEQEKEYELPELKALRERLKKDRP